MWNRKILLRASILTGLFFTGAILLYGCNTSGTRHYLQTVPAKPTKASDILITSLSHVPGYYIQKTGGVDCRFINFDDNEDYIKLMLGSLEGLRKDALKNGYNAVVNFRLSNGTWEAQGSAWRILMTQMWGDLVKVTPK